MTSRHSLPTLVTFLTALRASGGCSFTDSEADAVLGCTTYASGTCQTLVRCDALLTVGYGSDAACEAQLGAACTYSLGLPDVIGSGAGAAACGLMMQNLDCDSLRNGELPVGCEPPSGLRSDGAHCRVGAQCASARCTDFVGGWGVCRERAHLGELCFTAADCGTGLVCSLNGTCIVLGLSGEPCSTAQPCRAPLACVAGSCMAVEPAQTCQGFADTLCTRLASCSAALVQSIYGEVDVCAARTAASCLASLDGSDGTAASAAIAGCTLALDSAGCDQLLDHALPDACQLAPGPRADGATCNSAAQCASTRCAYDVGAACGVCTPLAALGDACTIDGDCPSGAICGGGVCRVPSPIEAACDAAQRCAYPGVCAAAGCVAAIGLGEPCSPSDDRCDREAGLFCAAAGSCEPWLNSQPGEACDQTPAGWAACSGGSSCIANRCEGPIRDGSPCVPDQAPFCLAPSQCLGSVCTLASEVSCS